MVTFPLFRLVFLRVWFVLSLLSLFSLGARAAAPGELTPWLTLSDLNAYLEELDGDKTEGKNFWDRGHWLTAVEGRWEEGVPQYRVSYSPVPAARRANWWQWFLNLDRQAFDARVHALADEGYTLVQFNSYTRPGGSERFQGVWHKLIPLTGALPLPQGRFRLTEVDGKAEPDAPVSLTIEGERISGITPNNEFKGSVRDRFSGSLTVNNVGRVPNTSSQHEAWLEQTFLKRLENATWKEDAGKIRVVKDGKTVLRFVSEEVKLEADKSVK